MKLKKLVLSITILSIFFTSLFAACSSNNSDKSNPIVTIEMKNGNKIVLELYSKKAPNTVKNFVSLIKKGFYDGLIFHRVIPGFMIQGGDPDGNGTGGPGYSIKGEFTNNSFKNNLKHTKGILSMARSNDYDSAGSQFFIMVADSPTLDNDYAAFGKVIKGYSYCEKISQVTRDPNDKPLKAQVIKKITVKKADNIGEPKKIK